MMTLYYADRFIIKNVECLMFNVYYLKFNER